MAATVAMGPSTVDGLVAARGEVLRLVSALSGFPADAVTTVPNTSTGLFQVAFALTGEVLVGAREFPANRYPWARAEEAGLLTVRTLPATTPASVAAALGPAGTAVAVSAVDFATGARADLPGLREAVGDRLLVVDGIQGFGAVDLDWTLADVLVVGGQKWLRSGWSTGFLALSERAAARLRPLLSGWTGAVDPTRYDGLVHPRAAAAQQFSLTNLSPVADVGFAAGLGLLASVGPAWVQQRIAARTAELLEGLDRLGVEVRSPRDPLVRTGIVALAVAGRAPQEVGAALAAAGVTVTVHAAQVRVSVHASTGPESVDLLLDVLARA